jgi:hypothetical protein
MSTERITLELTHDLDARLSDWIVEVVDESLGLMESVRVVEEAAPAASGGGVWHCARTSPPPIGDFKLCRWVTTVCGNRQVSYGEGARRADGMWGRSNRVEVIPPEQWQDLPASPSAGCERWESQAASGGGEGEPVADAWGIVRDGNVDSVTHRLFRNEAGDIAEKLGGTVVPLYRSPPQPRGWLSEEQRHGLGEIATYLDTRADCRLQGLGSMIRVILASSSPPEVVLDAFPTDETGESFSRRDVIKALAAAGVAVKEVGK